MLHFILLLIGSSLTLIGLFTAFLPIPGGVLPGILGMVLLVSVSPSVQKALTWARHRYAWVNRGLTLAEEKLRPHLPRVTEILSRTRPEP